MHRRAFLAAGVSATLAGCLTDGGDPDAGGPGEAPELQNPEFSAERSHDLPGATPDPSASTWGLAPEPEAVEVPEVDVDSLQIYDSYDEPVPLLPVEAAYAWYRRREARFVDARATTAFERNHVPGAAHSPAPDARSGPPGDDDPASTWPQAERIVAYCGCPHHLSGQRAAELLGQGHEAVYAIAEGFYEWDDLGYPTTSRQSQSVQVPKQTVSGRVSPSRAGEFVRVRDPHSNQVEPAEIQPDGSYTVEFGFYDVEPDDPLTVETPTGSTTRPAGELVDGTTR